MSGPNAYTVGWISALEKEYLAAQLFLEEQYKERVQRSANDSNHYTFGKASHVLRYWVILPMRGYRKDRGPQGSPYYIASWGIWYRLCCNCCNKLAPYLSQCHIRFDGWHRGWRTKQSARYPSG